VSDRAAAVVTLVVTAALAALCVWWNFNMI